MKPPPSKPRINHWTRPILAMSPVNSASYSFPFSAAMRFTLGENTEEMVVENVIKHAFRNLGHSGLTGISVRKKGTNLEITVYDNGRGIKKEELDKIQHNLRTDAGQHEFGSIGIQNVNHRLKLLFGAGYGLQIASISEKGTAVKVILPALYKEEMTEYVQAADNGR